MCSVIGGENYYIIIIIVELLLDEKVIWVGMDDGYFYVIKDGGESWEEVGIKMFDVFWLVVVLGKVYGGSVWVSCVELFRYVLGCCYVILDYYCYDDMVFYVLVIEDYG